MKETPIKKQIIDDAIADYGIQDFSKATIREVKRIAEYAEKKSGVEFIKMEMGIPDSLPPRWEWTPKSRLCRTESPICTPIFRALRC